MSDIEIFRQPPLQLVGKWWWDAVVLLWACSMTLKELGRSYLTVSKDVSKMPDSASKSGFLCSLMAAPLFRRLPTYREEMREENGAAYGTLPIEADKTFELCCLRLRFLTTKQGARRTRRAKGSGAQPEEDSPAPQTPNCNYELAAFREWEQLWKSILRKNRASMRQTRRTHAHSSLRIKFASVKQEQI